MDGLMLLHQAEQVGLRIQAVGGQLRISGPKTAAPLVKLLAEHKPKVLEALWNARQRQHWHERFTALTFQRSIGNRSWSDARRLAWGELQNEWHKEQGTRWPSWQ